MKSLCCELGTIIVLYVSCTSNKQKKNKLSEKEIRFVVTKDRGQGRGNRMKVVKRYKLPLTR